MIAAHAVARPHGRVRVLLSLPQRERAAASARAAWQRFEGTLAGEFLRTFVELRVVDRSLALASKAFVAILPLTILSTAVVSGRAFGDELVRRFGLTGLGASAARELFAAPSQVEASIGAFGFVILVASVLSFARALERVYLDAWRLPPPVGKATLGRVVWLGGVFVTLAALVEVHALWPHSGRTLQSLIGGGLFFVWTPYVLLSRRVSGRSLLPSSAITCVAVVALGIGSAIVMPGQVTRNTERYGLIGFTFSLVSWLFAAMLLIVSSAVLGALIARRYWPASSERGDAG
jgi:membrane protein